MKFSVTHFMQIIIKLLGYFQVFNEVFYKQVNPWIQYEDVPDFLSI